MAVTYPPAPPVVQGDSVLIHRLLNDPPSIARRVRLLAAQRFIADVLLPARFTAEGGSVTWEGFESLYTDRVPESIRPGREYPLTSFGIGPVQVATVQKWGQDVPVTDEAIKRLKRNPVDRAFEKLVNQMVKTVDSLALSVIASQVTQATPAAAAWTTATAKQIFLDVAKAKQSVLDLNEGLEPDTVVVSGMAWVAAMAEFADKGYLPRDTTAPVTTGQFPVIDGMRWLTSTNLPFTSSALVLDSNQLGGMADEDLGGPGYVSAQNGIETKSIRQDNDDEYRLRARRITVPIVIEPRAAFRITGVGA